MPSVNRAKPSLIGPCPASMGPSPAFWDPAQRYKSKLNLIGPCPASRDQAQQQINETRRGKDDTNERTEGNGYHFRLNEQLNEPGGRDTTNKRTTE